jgi:hypothetical protein
MKKLMIVAAAAAMVGAAYADLCDEVIDAGGCALYNVKFTFKTLAAKDAKCSATLLGSDACTALDADIATKGLAYLDNTTRKFEGILWQCEAACFEGAMPNEGAQGAGSINYVLWEKKSELAISPKSVYNSAADADPRWAGGGEAATEEAKFDILGRYGKKAQKVTAYWKPTMNADLAGNEIVAAGFGTFDTKKKVIKSLSGNAVAKLTPLAAGSESLCGEANTMIAVLAYMCHDFKSWCCCVCVNTALAPASGSWSLKYNSSLSKKGKLSKIIPDYAYEVQ